MGEQVADGGPGRASRLVEIDDPILDRIEDRQGRDELGHRRPPEAAIEIAVTRDNAARPDDGGCNVFGAPAVDRGEGSPKRVVHGG